MNKISEPLYDPKRLSVLFKQGVLRHFDSFYITYLKKNIHLFDSLGGSKQIAAAFLYNMFDCPSHRESLQTIFQSIY